MSQTKSVQFGIEFKCLKTVLNESRPQIIPVVLSVEIILSIDVLVCLVDCCYLPHPHICHYPSYVRILLYHFLELLIHWPIVNCYYFFQWVSVVFEKC